MRTVAYDYFPHFLQKASNRVDNKGKSMPELRKQVVAENPKLPAQASMWNLLFERIEILSAKSQDAASQDVTEAAPPSTSPFEPYKVTTKHLRILIEVLDSIAYFGMSVFLLVDLIARAIGGARSTRNFPQVKDMISVRDHILLRQKEKEKRERKRRCLEPSPSPEESRVQKPRRGGRGRPAAEQSKESFPDEEPRRRTTPGEGPATRKRNLSAASNGRPLTKIYKLDSRADLDGGQNKDGVDGDYIDVVDGDHIDVGVDGDPIDGIQHDAQPVGPRHSAIIQGGDVDRSSSPFPFLQD